MPAGKELMRRAGVASQIMRLPLLIVSGDRTPYQAWQLRMKYLRGTGNLAARCCRYSGAHSWSACGKTPTSNHARGKAIDCGWLTSSGYKSFMLVPGALNAARKAGMKAPMWPPWGGRIEAWHMENR